MLSVCTRIFFPPESSCTTQLMQDAPHCSCTVTTEQLDNTLILLNAQYEQPQIFQWHIQEFLKGGVWHWGDNFFGPPASPQDLPLYFPILKSGRSLHHFLPMAPCTIKHTPHQSPATPNFSAAAVFCSKCCRKVFISVGMEESTAVTSTTFPFCNCTPTRGFPVPPCSQNCSNRSLADMVLW